MPEPVDPYFSLYQAALGATWQVDLFGRVRRLSEAAQAQVYASEQAQRGVVLTLVTGVATSYFTLRGLDRQREIAVATAGNFGETARIFDLRFKSGIVSKTEVAQVRSQYQQAQASIPIIEQQIAAVRKVRSRSCSGAIRGRFRAARRSTNSPRRFIPADLPSTLLERRPDILQAEQNLVAANASIGAARALYYPTISLTGAYGSTSTAAGSFLTGPATTWQAAASLTGPIFTFGAIEGQVQSAEAQKAQAELVYQSAILNAFRDTNDALIGTQKTIESLAFQRERVISLREFARLSRLKFESGLIGYLEVLVAETDLFAAELALASLTSDRYTQVVNVYQAMGGGWVDIADSMTPRPVGMVEAKDKKQP